MRGLLFVFLTASSALAATAGSCWQDPNDGYGKALKEVEAAAELSALNAAVSHLVDVGRNVHCFVEFAGERAVVQALIEAFENSRTDKQMGSTSLVSRGAAAKVIGFAVENGVLTRSVNGQTVTVAGNLAGLGSLLASRDLFPYCDPRAAGTEGGSCISSSALRFARRLSFSASMNAGSTSVSAFTGRLELVNRRDVTSSQYQAAWRVKAGTESTLRASAVALLDEMDVAMGPLLKSPIYVAWYRKATDRMTAAKRRNESLAPVWAGLLSELVISLRRASLEFQTNVDRLRAAFQHFDLAEDTLIDTIGGKPLVTFEFGNTRSTPQTPAMSVVRLIGELGWAKRNNVTVNAAASFEGAIHDLQASAQYERRLGSSALDLSAYFENRPGMRMVAPGKIGIAQIGLVLMPGKSSMRIPVAISYSNRTQLTMKPTWRAQLGLTYDFDALFAK